ncbi:hypothetical protein V2J09_001721 [Rumex salicifolius]
MDNCNLKQRDDGDDECFGSDQILEILSWMPAKAAIKCSSLSKSLSTLIFFDPLFLERQAFHSSLVNAGIFIEVNDISMTEFYALPGFNGGSMGLRTESLSFIKEKNGDITASTQGLLLASKLPPLRYTHYNHDTPELVVCNLVTRWWVPVIFPDCLVSREYMRWSSPFFECRGEGDAGSPTLIVLIRGLPFLVFKLRSGCVGNGRWEEDTCQLRLRPHDVLRVEKSVGLFNQHGGLVLHYLCDRHVQFPN